MSPASCKSAAVHAVRNVYLNNNVYICSGSQSPLPFLSRDVSHSYRSPEKHETEVRFSNKTILLGLWAMRIDVRLQLHCAIYRPDSFVFMLRYCANLKAIRYESTSFNRIVADKSHRVIAA